MITPRENQRNVLEGMLLRSGRRLATPRPAPDSTDDTSEPSDNPPMGTVPIPSRPTSPHNQPGNQPQDDDPRRPVPSLHLSVDFDTQMGSAEESNTARIQALCEERDFAR
jgi:hypothetical protein